MTKQKKAAAATPMAHINSLRAQAHQPEELGWVRLRWEATGALSWLGIGQWVNAAGRLPDTPHYKNLGLRNEAAHDFLKTKDFKINCLD
jgi:hypothetical protein